MSANHNYSLANLNYYNDSRLKFLMKRPFKVNISIPRLKSVVPDFKQMRGKWIIWAHVICAVCLCKWNKVQCSALYSICARRQMTLCPYNWLSPQNGAGRPLPSVCVGTMLSERMPREAVSSVCNLSTVRIYFQFCLSNNRLLDFKFHPNIY